MDHVRKDQFGYLLPVMGDFFRFRQFFKPLFINTHFSEKLLVKYRGATRFICQ